MARLIINIGYKTFLAPAGSLDTWINFINGLVPVKQVNRYSDPDKYVPDEDKNNKIEFKIVNDDVDQVDEDFWEKKCKAVEDDLSKKDNEYWKKYNEVTEANNKVKELETKIKSLEDTVSKICTMEE